MKQSYFILELILVLLVASLIYLSVIPNTQNQKSSQFIDKLLIYIKQVRYQAMIDNKYNPNEDLWHKKLWTVKFLRCRSNIGGIYFSIYSDKNLTGKINKEDSLVDPLTNTYLYSSNYCSENSSNNSDTLLSKNYDIETINLTCNNTTSLGQLSFDSYSRVYSKLSNQSDDYEDYILKDNCTIEITDKMGNLNNIIVESNTGYTYKKTN
jgi:type II secretory pathway pseudopilin PulG